MSRLKPRRIRIESSSACQLACPSCPTTTRAIHPAIGTGTLKLRDFERLLDNSPFIRDIELSNYGELFLNPELIAIMRLAHERGVILRADNGTNLNHLPPQVIEALVRYRFRSLTCSIDGASPETYPLYRVGGDFNKVMDHIRQINEEKKRMRTPYPRLTWQFVVFGHNEHEIAKARQMAQQLGMRFVPKLSWDEAISPVRDPDLVRSVAGAATRSEYVHDHGVDYMRSICHQLWDQPQFNWDGRSLGCCRNFWGDLGGNVFDDGVEKLVNNERSELAREMVQGREKSRPDIPCTTCSIYIEMQSSGNWLRRSESTFRRALRRIRTLFY